MDTTGQTTTAAYRWRWLPAAGMRLRLRLLGWLVLLVTVAGLAGLLVLRQALLDGLDARVDAGLEQQAASFRAVAGADPGQPGDLTAVADRYLAAAAPGPDRAVLVFIDGRLHGTAGAPAGALAADPRLVRQWDSTPGGYGTSSDTPAGPLRWLAVPLTAGGEPAGQLVVAEATSAARGAVDRTVRTAAVGLAVVVVATAASGYLVVRRTLRPLRELTRTAGQIARGDFSGDAKAAGSDEVTALGQTFHALSDQLERAFSTQQAFLSDVGHELRTPLTIVRGHLELMGDDPIERRETVALVTDELDRMNRMVDDLLVLARAERPDFLQLTEVEVAAVMQDVYAKAAALGDRDWRLDPVPEVTLRADRQRLTQALMQLAQNAVQFTEPGDRVTLSAKLDERTVSLAVSDTGEGIAPEDQERIFARFGRAASGRARSEGAGLGLAIVAAIAAAHGGTVAVESALGVGSTFTIALPRDSRDDRTLVEVTRA